jgi:hypothetical protein
MRSHIWHSYFEAAKIFIPAADRGDRRQAALQWGPGARRPDAYRDRRSGVHQTEVNIARAANTLAILLCRQAKSKIITSTGKLPPETLWQRRLLKY